MKKRHTLLGALALFLALTAALPSAWAYFTANASAGGGRTVRVSAYTDITEEFADWEKSVVVTAQPVTPPLYLRARAYSTYALEYRGEEWTPGNDGWYYYNYALANPGEGDDVALPAWARRQSGALKVIIRVDGAAPGTVPEDFDVTVVYETTPVVYNADGSHPSAAEADWNVPQGGGDAG